MSDPASPTPPAPPSRAGEWLWPLLILVLALAVRWLAVARTGIINPDGPLYIHQARAMWYGHWAAIPSCAAGIIFLPLSLFPFLIAGAYALIGDWLLAARLVGIICGGAAVPFIWALARRFVPSRAAGLTTLAFALMPVLVELSAEVVRGPLFFLCLAWGTWLLVRALEKTGSARGWSLVWASVCLSLAVFTRVEGLVYLAGAGLFVLFFNGSGRRLKDLACLALPSLVLAGLGLIALSALPGLSGSAGGPDPASLWPLLFKPVQAYAALVQALDALRQTSPPGLPPEFLVLTRDYIWIIGLAATVHLLLDSLWYPFALAAFYGLAGSGRAFIQDRRLACLALIGLLALLGVYLGLISTWWPTRRFWVVALLPWLPWLGLGFDRLLNLLQKKGLRPATALILLAVLALAVTVPRLITTREADKAVFKAVGRSIAVSPGRTGPVKVAAPGESTALWWIVFYANLDFPGAPCPRPEPDPPSLKPGKSIWEVNNRYLAQGIGYYLCLENQAQPPWLTLALQTPGCLTELGRWSHPDTGQVTLFRVNPEH